MNDNKNFGDIVESILIAREAEERAKSEAARAESDRQWAERQMKMRPLLLAVQQTEDKFPRTHVHGCGPNDRTGPYFYIGENTSIRLRYDSKRDMLGIVRSAPGAHARLVAEHQNAEELLPTLLELLASAVAFGLKG